MSTTQRDRLSAEEKTTMLQQMGTTQPERLAAESAEEREARLLHVSANQLQRRAAESSSLTQKEQFKQRSVRLKMRKFYEHFTSQSSPTHLSVE